MLEHGCVALTTNGKIVSTKCKCSLCRGEKAPNTVKRYSLTDKSGKVQQVKLCTRCAKKIETELKK